MTGNHYQPFETVLVKVFDQPFQYGDFIHKCEAFGGCLCKGEQAASGTSCQQQGCCYAFLG
jgi:hypothetical protein